MPVSWPLAHPWLLSAVTYWPLGAVCASGIPGGSVGIPTRQVLTLPASPMHLHREFALEPSASPTGWRSGVAGRHPLASHLSLAGRGISGLTWILGWHLADCRTHQCQDRLPIRPSFGQGSESNSAYKEASHLTQVRHSGQALPIEARRQPSSSGAHIPLHD